MDRLWRHCPALAPVGGMGPIGGRRRVCGTREAILGYPNRDPRLVPSVHTRHGRRTALFEKPNSKGVWCVSRSISKYFRPLFRTHTHTRLNISETRRLRAASRRPETPRSPTIPRGPRAAAALGPDHAAAAQAALGLRAGVAAGVGPSGRRRRGPPPVARGAAAWLLSPRGRGNAAAVAEGAGGAGAAHRAECDRRSVEAPAI